MNVLCSPLRTRLSIAHLSSLMSVGMEGPPMSSFEPTAYVKSWLAAGRHAATTWARLRKKQRLDLDPGKLQIGIYCIGGLIYNLFVPTVQSVDC